MSTTVKVIMEPVNVMIKKLGIDESGDVQRFLTSTISKRMTRYMPFRSGGLSTKLKIVASPTEIQVLGPYARYQYYGKVMVGPAPKHLTDRDLRYGLTKNPLAGPFWDRRLMAAEGDEITAETQSYIDRRSGT